MVLPVVTPDLVADYVGAALIGITIGLSELASRYRDEPGSVVKTLPGLLYVFLNVGLATGALALIKTSGWTFSAPAGSGRLTQVLVAGFGAMALFRSSLFTVRIGTQDVGVGPSSVLQIFLAAVDRAVDRKRAEQRNSIIDRIMPGVSFARARSVLPAHCFALLQNPSPEDQAIFGRQVELLDKITDVSDHAKASLLGLALMSQVGEDVLEAAVKTLGDEIKKRDQNLHDLLRGVSYRKAREVLPAYCMALLPRFSAEEQSTLAGKIQALDQNPMDDALKARLLGLTLINLVGDDYFTSAVTALGDALKAENSPPAP